MVGILRCGGRPPSRSSPRMFSVAAIHSTFSGRNSSQQYGQMTLFSSGLTSAAPTRKTPFAQPRSSPHHASSCQPSPALYQFEAKLAHAALRSVTGANSQTNRNAVQPPGQLFAETGTPGPTDDHRWCHTPPGRRGTPRSGSRCGTVRNPPRPSSGPSPGNRCSRCRCT